MITTPASSPKSGKSGFFFVDDIHRHRLKTDVFEVRQYASRTFPWDMLQNEHLWCGHDFYCGTSVPRLRNRQGKSMNLAVSAAVKDVFSRDCCPASHPSVTSFGPRL